MTNRIFDVLALIGGLFVAGMLLVLIFLGSSMLTRGGEKPFTADQRSDLSEQVPGGEFIDASYYRYCGGDGFFWYVDSARRLTTNNERCANWLRSR